MLFIQKKIQKNVKNVQKQVIKFLRYNTIKEFFQSEKKYLNIIDKVKNELMEDIEVKNMVTEEQF